MESLNLTPAESLMIISPDSNGIEMIKITLVDLLLKKALKLNNEHHNSRFLKKNYKSVIILRNKSFDPTFKPHEKVLVEILDNEGLELKEFVKTLFKQIKSSDYKNKYVRMPLIDKGYFQKQRKMLLALVPYNTYGLTENGLEVKSKIMELINEAECLEKWIKEDLGHAKAYLSVMGSHILISNAYDVKDIQKFNKMLSYIKPEAKTSDYYDYYLYTVPADFLDDNGDLQSFDFMDISLLDNFNDLFIDFDAGSDDDSIHEISD